MISESIVSRDIAYCGFAKLTVLRNDKALHTYRFKNNGTQLLFTALAATLCGQNQTLNMPKYFDCGEVLEVSGGQGNRQYLPALNSRVTLASQLVRNYTDQTTDTITHAKVAAVFTAYIPSRLVRSGANINRLALYSKYEDNDRDSLLAEIELDDSAFPLEASESYSYIVEWVMTFSNVTNQVALTSKEA